jgi:DUF1365 family protein
MPSCLYECEVLHARFAPKPHRFVYRLFFFALDLDELETLHGRLALFSVNRPNLYSFRERDFLPTSEPIHHGYTEPANLSRPSLKQRVTDFVAARGVDLTGGRVLLVTLPRILGYLFNPVSFYFCYDRHGECVAALSEVTNTFREMKPFYLGPTTQTEGAFRLRTPKHFYVSPFSDVDVDFDFILRPPAERLAVQIDDYTGGQRTLTSLLTGPRRDLTNGRLAWFTLKYPLLTLRIISLIHWHALLLWLKRVPWFAKASRAADQRDLYRPHASIAQPQDVA